MDSASSLAYPGSRVVAGWWQQLQPHQPTGLWIGYLFVHRVEALVECAAPRPIDALSLHLLRALAVERGAPAVHEHRADLLSGRLHLPPPAVERLLAGLADKGLARRCEPGCWCLSEHGSIVLRDGADLTPRRERCAFPFVERLNPAGRRVAMPHFVALHECPAQPWAVDDAHRFDLALLRETMSQTAEWRARHVFPAGMGGILDAATAEPDSGWEQVIVDRPERVPIALATVGTHGEILGFAAHVAGWNLLGSAPVLRLGAQARDALPELAVAPSIWEEAWRLWCRQRSLPRADAEACRLSFDGIHLDVQAPESLVQRLRLAKTELQPEESGLLAGDGYLRAVALLRLHVQA